MGRGERRYDVGREWVVDALGCRPEALRDLSVLRALLQSVVGELGLRLAAEPQWRVFEGEGGVTGLLLLAESHLSVHTFPEHGVAAINLYCCVPRPAWPWEARLADALGARHVRVRALERGAGPDEGAALRRHDDDRRPVDDDPSPEVPR